MKFENKKLNFFLSILTIDNLFDNIFF